MNKRSAGGASVAGVPSYIRAVGTVLTPADRKYLKQKLDQKLAKLGSAVLRASVRVEDVNGPRGGVDKRCQIKVVLRGLPSMVVAEHHRSVKGAMDSALARTELAARRAIERRRP